MSNDNEGLDVHCKEHALVIVGHTSVREPKNGMRFLKDPTVHFEVNK